MKRIVKSYFLFIFYCFQSEQLTKYKRNEENFEIVLCFTMHQALDVYKICVCAFSYFVASFFLFNKNFSLFLSGGHIFYSFQYELKKKN